MKKFNKFSSVALSLAVLFSFASPVKAAVFPFTPSLGAAATYGVLSDTFTNPVGPTTINGDVGFTTGPFVAPLGIHSNYGSGVPYSQAGIDQAAALSDLNSQDCSYTFPPGAVDLATDTTHIPAFGSILGEYVPGKYCTAGAASTFSVGTAGINLNGAGTYVFSSDGALNIVTGSIVTLTGASACDIFWTPNGATTLNHDSTFAGTVIPILAAGHDITIMDGVIWTGRALTFGHTVTTPGANVTVSVPVCTTPSLTLNKIVVNDNGRTAVESNWTLTATGPSTISGPGATGSADLVSGGGFLAGVYTLSETGGPAGYTASSWACTNGVVVNSSSEITMGTGSVTVCSITNDDKARSSGSTVIGSTPPVAPAPVIQPNVEIISSPIPVTPIQSPQLPRTGSSPARGNILLLLSLTVVGVGGAFLYPRQRKTSF
jgi:hypothetical protein